MRAFFSLVTSTIVAGWISTIAILAIQNFTPVSLRFLAAQSIEIPIGLVLAFSAGAGMVGMALVRSLLGNSSVADD